MALAIAVCSWKSGDFIRARTFLNEAVQISGVHIRTVLTRAEFLLEAGDLEAARNVFSQLSDTQQRVSNNPDFHRIQSRLAELSGDNQTGLNSAIKVLEFRPADREAHSRVARLLQKLGRVSEAGDYYERSHLLAKSEIALWNLTRTLPDVPTPQDCRQVSSLYQQLGKTDQAREWSKLADRLKASTRQHRQDEA
ncbi:MAG: tetratricopeptide repeat protein [Planctomycetaceae bacterium]